MRNWGVLSAAIVGACFFVRCVGDDPSVASGPGDTADGSVDGSKPDPAEGGGTDGAGTDAPIGDGTLPDGALPPLTTTPSVAVAYGFSCALRTTGRIFCWGSDSSGQLGRASVTAGGPTPAEVATVTDAARIGLGNGFGCALKKDHTVVCWGNNGLGTVGQPIATASFPTPTAIAGLTNVVELAVGGAHVCVRKADKSVWCWGGNGTNQLGYDNATDAACISSVKCNPVPKAVAGVVADAISSGIGHSCARVGTTAVCWGANNASQLGHLAGQGGDNGDNANATPTAAAATGVAAVFSGGETTCMLSSAGIASCWGADDQGQLGDQGAVATSADPVVVATLPSPVLRVAPGWKNSCAVQNSSAYCWGGTSYGVMGIDVGAGVTKAPSTRVIFPNSASIIDVASTHPGSHHCALASTQSVYCWGINTAGETGHASASDPTCDPGGKCTPTPMLVSGLP